MKKEKETIFSTEKIFKAYFNCRQNKRKTSNALRFEWDFENNLEALRADLSDRTYAPGKSICFVVLEPSTREIFAADFRDRIVHHLLVNEIIESAEKKFIYDSYACRVDKGTHRAMLRLKDFIRKVTKNNTTEVFYLHLDIKSFFMSIDKKILFDIYQRFIKKEKKSPEWKREMLWLGKTIIFHNPTSDCWRKKGLINNQRVDLSDAVPFGKSLFDVPFSRGLPIGNYSSQFFANLYLDKLDQYVKRKLRCPFYIRYVDDLILLDVNAKKLDFWQKQIVFFLKKFLDLEINSKKTKIENVKKGIDFLGYYLKPTHILVRKKVLKRFKNKFFKLNKNDKDFKKIPAVKASFCGHAKWANANKLVLNYCV
ncbi:MAG: RNA-directed DNA polymerase [Sphingobacteriia bacterium]|nr:RNA-directed DNA polymerase [Sphingobacteriia bacterium]